MNKCVNELLNKLMNYLMYKEWMNEFLLTAISPLRKRVYTSLQDSQDQAPTKHSPLGLESPLRRGIGDGLTC